MDERMKILKEVAIRGDKFRNYSEDLGKIAAKAFGTKKHQMRSLENIANSAMKISDVLDYIKRQTGKSKPNAEWKKEGFGKTLLQEIEEQRIKERDKICQTLGIDSEEKKLEIYLLLVREFIRQIVIHYEYESGK